MTDFAIIVGIDHYPGFGATVDEANNLSGPDRDATKIYEWLTSKTGGNVPTENVTLIRTQDFPAAQNVLSAEPQLHRIQLAFQSLLLKPKQNGRIGRRLYIYMSGHGFAPNRYEGGLFLANATSINTQNVYASGWLNWFQDSGYFEEFVLWMDCCMDRMFTILPEAIPFRRVGSIFHPGPTMIAFAAPRPLKAVETEIDGKVRGVFTYTLLKGLKGAAVEASTGTVTGASLGDYLLNAMKGFMRQEHLVDTEIAKEPEIVKADKRIVLAAAPTAEEPKYHVIITAPGVADGEVLQLWSGKSPVPSLLNITNGKATADLPRGLYLADIPAAALREGFEVNGSGSAEVVVPSSYSGPPVSPPAAGASFNIQIDPKDDGAEIFIVDDHFELVERGKGQLKLSLSYGIYKFKVRLARDLHEQIVLVDHDGPVSIMPAPLLTSSAIIQEVRLDGAAFQSIVPGRSPWFTHLVAGSGAEIFVMIHGGKGSESNQAHPGEGVKLYNNKGLLIADFAVHGERSQASGKLPDDAPHTLAQCNMQLFPGLYFLRQRLDDGSTIEQSIFASEGWRTEVFLSRLSEPGASPSSMKRQCAILTHRLNEPFRIDEDEYHAMEVARVALADQRKILSDGFRMRLVTEFSNPIAGILGGHLLLIEAASGGETKLGEESEQLDRVVTRLREMVGRSHPDVESLSYCCRQPGLRSTTSLPGPPMFARSWALAVKAGQEGQPLIPAALWDRVRATTTLAPYFVWASDKNSRKAHAKLLVEAVVSVARTPLPQPEPTARHEVMEEYVPDLEDDIEFAAGSDLKNEVAGPEHMLRDIVGLFNIAPPTRQVFDGIKPGIRSDMVTAPSAVHMAANSEVIQDLSRQWGIPSAALFGLVKKARKDKRIGS